MTRTRLPLVSIVTPTLQRAELLERTLRSVAAQTYPNVEHIVVDGGSTDGTLDILRRFEAERGIRWVSEPDKGMYDAINKGLRMVRGEIIAYLNSDDLYFPWAVASAIEVFERHADTDLVYGDLIRIDRVRNVVAPIFTAPYTRLSPAFGTLLQPSTFWRREMPEDLNGFDATLRFVADADFWFRAAERFQFRRVSEFLAVDLWHETSLSYSRRREMAREDAEMRARHRRGLAGTAVGRAFAYVRWHFWTGNYWLAFALATHGRSRGWERFIAACQPRIGLAAAILGWLPSKGSGRRSAVTWERDPIEVALGESDG